MDWSKTERFIVLISKEEADLLDARRRKEDAGRSASAGGESGKNGFEKRMREEAPGFERPAQRLMRLKAYASAVSANAYDTLLVFSKAENSLDVLKGSIFSDRRVCGDIPFSAAAAVAYWADACADLGEKEKVIRKLTGLMYREDWRKGEREAVETPSFLLSDGCRRDVKLIVQCAAPGILLIYTETGAGKYSDEERREGTCVVGGVPEYAERKTEGGTGGAKAESVRLQSKKALYEDEPAKIEIRTFGYFDVFLNGRPLYFPAKMKELLAMVVDRQGGYLSLRDAIVNIWNVDGISDAERRRYVKLRWELEKQLDRYGIGQLVERERGLLRLNVNMVTCDLLAYTKDLRNNLYLFNGSYLSEYTWAEVTRGGLTMMRESFEIM